IHRGQGGVMHRLAWRRGAALVAALALIATAAALTAVFAGRGGNEANAAAKGDAPAAVEQHNEDIAAAHGQNQNERSDTPDSAAVENYNAHAYPFSEVTPAEQQSPANAFGKIKAKGVGNGKNSSSSWFALGPSQAQFPPILNRHGSLYWDAGRTTAMAISPDCTQKQCRLWIGAAGGGVW